nr:hypothetical protein [Ornithinimicrobium avium]
MTEKVPQAAPGLIDRFRQVAAQLSDQPGDQHGVLVVGLVERQVLGLARPGGDRGLHAHERHAPVSRELAQDPPPVPGRLTGDRDAGEPVAGPVLACPVQRGAKVPGLAPEGAPGQDAGVVVAHHDHLLAVGKVDAHDRIRGRDRFAQPGQPGVPVPVTTRDTTTVRH